MAKGPVQVITNPDRFREPRISRRGGGAGKDFFKDMDAAFDEHRSVLLQTLSAIARRRSSALRINLVVQMRSDALAKSHRPFGSLLTPAQAAHVGTEDFGELIFALTPVALVELIKRIGEAESEGNWVETPDGERVYKPSGRRAETSAIASVREWDPAMMRGFDLHQARDWLSSDASVKARVMLFNWPQQDVLSSGAVRAFRGLLSSASEFANLFELELPHGWPAGLQTALGEGGASRYVEGPLWGDQEGEGEREPFVETALEFDAEQFERGLAFFESSSLVMRVRLEDRINSEAPPLLGPELDDSLPLETSNAPMRPVVGVIDGGVRGPLGEGASVVGRTGLLADAHRSLIRTNHGSTIASLVAQGSWFNPGFLSGEEDCAVFDLDLFPDASAFALYYASLEDFVEILRTSVERAKAETGARVFNLSYNAERAPGNQRYSLAAVGLDEIARELDVIFVISAGNFSDIDERPEWPAKATDAVAMLGGHASADGLLAPAESILNVSVGAVNPPGLAGAIEGVPTRYTRRGTQQPSALKPDFAAPGGAHPEGARKDTGLAALDAFGKVRGVKGTSYAAPLVARYLASLDSAIAGHTSRETLLALAVHHSSLPAEMSHKSLEKIAPSFLGHGTLPTVAETLDGSDYAMTFILSDAIMPGKRSYFPFTWPASLTTSEGKCRGLLGLTLVAEPVLDYAHGAEAVRVNIDAVVRQADQAGRFSSRATATHEFFSNYRYAREFRLTNVLGKWYPVKTFLARMPEGRGSSADWEISFDYLTRDVFDLTENGVRFSAVVTIADLKREAPVFDEMRASLSSIGVALSDLRTATSIGVAT